MFPMLPRTEFLVQAAAVSRSPSAQPGTILPSAPLLASIRTLPRHDDLHGESALTGTFPNVSKP
jgi:hypothetical protein